jgi:hypothetical protein
MGVIHDFALVGDRWRDGHLYQLTAEEWMGSDATP